MDYGRFRLNAAMLCACAMGFIAAGGFSAPAAQAQDNCGSGCVAAPDLAQDISRRRVDRTLATNPAGERIGRLDGSGSTDAALPFAMTPDGNNTNFGTSLTQWGSAMSTADKEKLEQAKAAAGDDAALPKQIKTRQPKFDVWTKARRELFTDDGTVSKDGEALTTYVGADYRASKNFLVGGMVQLDDSRQTVTSASETANGKAFMAGPYMAYRVTPHVVVDAKAGWGRGQDIASTEAGSDNFVADRKYGEAAVTGNWKWKSWQLSQSGNVTYMDETAQRGPGADAGQPVDVTRLSAGPELKRHFDTANGGSVEPFAFFKSSLDVDQDGPAAPLAQNTVGGGIAVLKQDKYNIRASADYTESSDAANVPVATGKVQVKVPSSLFGF